MGKAIIFFFILFLIPIVFAATSYDYFYNPYTAKQDRSVNLLYINESITNITSGFTLPGAWDSNNDTLGLDSYFVNNSYGPPNFTSDYEARGDRWDIANTSAWYITDGWNILNDTSNWLTNFVANGWHILNDTANWLTNYNTNGWNIVNDTANWLTNYNTDGFKITNHTDIPHPGNTSSELDINNAIRAGFIEGLKKLDAEKLGSISLEDLGQPETWGRVDILGEIVGQSTSSLYNLPFGIFSPRNPALSSNHFFLASVMKRISL